MKENKQKIKAFMKDALKVRLTKNEKQRIQSRVFVSPYSFVAKQAWSQRNLVAWTVLIAIIVTGSGTSYAAVSALPGEALYGIKVNVNEELRSFAAITPNAKAKVEIGRANERLDEAVKLSQNGKLNKQNQSVITSKLKEHTEVIKANVAELASENKLTEATSVITDLKMTIDEHEQSLKNISTSTASTTDIISSVAEVKAEINVIQNDIDTMENTTPTATTTNGTSTTVAASSTRPGAGTEAGQASTTTASSTAEAATIEQKKLFKVY